MLQGLDSFLLFFFRQTFNVYVCLPAACLHSGSSVTPLVDVSVLERPGAFTLHCCVLGALLGLLTVCQGLVFVLVLLGVWRIQEQWTTLQTGGFLSHLWIPAVNISSSFYPKQSFPFMSYIKKADVSHRQMAARSCRVITCGGENKINEEGINNATCCILWKHEAVRLMWGLNNSTTHRWFKSPRGCVSITVFCKRKVKCLNFNNSWLLRITVAFVCLSLCAVKNVFRFFFFFDSSYKIFHLLFCPNMTHDFHVKWTGHVTTLFPPPADV